MPVFSDDIPADDQRYTRDISFPFRFNEDCDLLMDENEELIEQALNLITFIRSGTIRLFQSLGSSVALALFDQLDAETELIIDTSLRNAFETNEPRILIDKEMTFDQTPDERKLIVIVPYRIKITAKLAATKLVIDRPLVTG